MTLHDNIRAQLRAIETVMRLHQHWQDEVPDASAFNSDQPFCMDTLAPLEWLQWVLIPRMHQLLDNGQPLPQNFAIAPYYEVALDASHPLRERVLPELQALDALFADDNA
jgi:uncharacterized protein YqcC (DUF446 family)